MSISRIDLKDLRYAKSLLENPGLAAKISNLLGTPIEKGFELIPDKWHGAVQKVTKDALEKVLDFAVRTIGYKSKLGSSDLTHKLFVTATGAGGGAFGLPALAIELPVSTTIMLRSIADIARSEGEDIKEVKTKLACLEVFALGGQTGRDDATETGYFAVRTALAKTVSEAAEYIAKKGMVKKGGPVLVKFINAVAARFGLVVSEKVVAQAVPLLGAAGGAVINAIFIDHFQDIARGHFIVRRLERKYGEEFVRQEFEKLSL
jgi:hypothetical protein